MANHTHYRPHRYISTTYKCPATQKAVRLPPEQLIFIAIDMKRRGIRTFSEYIRTIIGALIDNDNDRDAGEQDSCGND